MFEKVLLKFIDYDCKLVTPPNPDMGDFCLPCFELAKKLKTNPSELAKTIGDSVNPKGILRKVQVQGPYVNFFLDSTKAGSLVVSDVLSKKEKFGSSSVGKGKKALIEHTSINPNASPHIGRARNSFIGDCLARVLRFNNFKTDVHYFVNDIGKQIALLVIGCRDKTDVSFDDLLKIYIDVNNKLKDDPSIEQDAFDLLSKFEAGDSEVQNLFNDVVKICIEGQSKIFGDLGIHFDSYDYESKYIQDNSVNKALDRLKKSGKVFTDEDNREVLNLDGFNLPLKNPVLVLTRADGTSLYSLRDIAYNIEKNRLTDDVNIVVLGEDQKTYMQVITASLEIIDEPSPVAVHYSFVVLKDGKMSTRKGNVVLLEDFMKEAVKKAKQTSKLDDDELAKQVGFGAVKFAILKVSNERSVTFDLDSALAFEGDTSVYCQYAHARIHSILKKAKFTNNVDFSKLVFSERSEHNLIMHISKFASIVEDVMISKNPTTLAHYVLSLCRSFSEFYHDCKVIGSETQESRLALCAATAQTVKNALYLLGIEAPEEM